MLVANVDPLNSYQSLKDKIPIPITGLKKNRKKFSHCHLSQIAQIPKILADQNLAEDCPLLVMEYHSYSSY